MEKVLVAAHPRYGYQFDFQTRRGPVSGICELGTHRRTALDEVRIPAYKKQFNVFKDFAIGRSSPVWMVSKGAMQCKGSARLAGLSRPKRLHPDYQPCRSVATVVPSSAKTAACSTRIETLSEPKKRSEIREREWVIRRASLKAQASERVQELSHAKGPPMGYLPDKYQSWHVSKAAQNTRASVRVETLAKPIIRQVANNLPRDDAFSVSKAAQKARCTDRIADLSQPILRK